jgi:hypothetical protein
LENRIFYSSEITNLSQETPKVKRHPRSILFWISVALFLGFSFLGWLRLQQSIVNWQWLVSIGVTPGPLYLAITGGLWGVAGLAAGIGLWLRWPWARLVAKIAVIFLVISYWADRLAFSRAGDDQANLVFAIIVSLIGMGFVFAELSRQEVRQL